MRLATATVGTLISCHVISFLPLPSMSAVQQASALAGQAAEEEQRARPFPRVLTKKELIEKLDKMFLFNVCVHTGNKKQTIAVGGELVWYADPTDAKMALEQAKALDPTGAFALDVTPLGRAFALSEGWMGPPPGQAPPMRLQASASVVQACGADGNTLPDKLKAKMNQRTGPFPLFFMEELQADDVVPYFFTKEDLVGCWTNSGKSAESLPSSLTLSDLRVLVIRMLTEEADWSKVTLVPMQKAVDLMAMIDELQSKREQVAAAVAAAVKKRGEDPEADPPPLS